MADNLFRILPLLVALLLSNLVDCISGFDVSQYSVALGVQRDLANETTIDRLLLPSYTLYANPELLALSNTNYTASQASPASGAFLVSNNGLWFSNGLNIFFFFIFFFHQFAIPFFFLGPRTGTIKSSFLESIDVELPLGIIRRLDIHVFFNPDRGSFQFCPFFEAGQFKCDPVTDWQIILAPISRYMAESSPLSPSYIKGPFLVVIHPHVNFTQLVEYDISKEPIPTTTTAPATPTTTVDATTSTTTATASTTTLATTGTTSENDTLTTSTTDAPTPTPTARKRRDGNGARDSGDSSGSPTPDPNLAYPSVQALLQYSFVAELNQNISSYTFSADLLKPGSGWPTQASLFNLGQWLIFAFGSTSDYDTTKDESIIFPPGSLDLNNTLDIDIEAVVLLCNASFYIPDAFQQMNISLTDSFQVALDDCTQYWQDISCLSDPSILNPVVRIVSPSFGAINPY